MSFRCFIWATLVNFKISTSSIFYQTLHAKTHSRMNSVQPPWHLNYITTCIRSTIACFDYMPISFFSRLAVCQLSKFVITKYIPSKKHRELPSHLDGLQPLWKMHISTSSSGQCAIHPRTTIHRRSKEDNFIFRVNLKAWTILTCSEPRPSEHPQWQWNCSTK